MKCARPSCTRTTVDGKYLCDQCETAVIRLLREHPIGDPYTVLADDLMNPDLWSKLEKILPPLPKREPLETAEVKAQQIARLIESMLPQGWGFTLILWSLNSGKDGFLTFVSNVEKEGLIKALHEMLENIEQQRNEA